MTGTFAFPRNAFLGFDHIFDQLDNIHSHAKDTYPPHNVVKDEEMKYTLEIAVAAVEPGAAGNHVAVKITKDLVIKIQVVAVVGDGVDLFPANLAQKFYRVVIDVFPQIAVDKFEQALGIRVPGPPHIVCQVPQSMDTLR